MMQCVAKPKLENSPDWFDEKVVSPFLVSRTTSTFHLFMNLYLTSIFSSRVGVQNLLSQTCIPFHIFLVQLLVSQYLAWHVFSLGPQSWPKWFSRWTQHLFLGLWIGHHHGPCLADSGSDFPEVSLPSPSPPKPHHHHHHVSPGLGNPSSLLPVASLPTDFKLSPFAPDTHTGSSNARPSWVILVTLYLSSWFLCVFWTFK